MSEFGFQSGGSGGGSGPASCCWIVQCGTGGLSTLRICSANTASGNYSTAFGQCNTASGQWSTVSGGRNNTSSGNYSFVGGGNGNNANLASYSVAPIVVQTGGILVTDGSKIAANSGYLNLTTNITQNSSFACYSVMSRTGTNISIGFGTTTANTN
jgi:hypothetical protein